MVSYSNNSLTAIILAGGRSSRMGQDKALLTVEGMPLLERVYRIASACTSKVFIVTPWSERYVSILPQTCQFIREDTPTQGPLVAFSQALTQIETEWVLLLACDLPLLTSSEVQRWTDSLGSVAEGAIAYLPRQDNLWQSSVGFYRRRCLAALQEFIDQGGRSFQGWLDRSPAQELSVSDPKILFNCNTPDDLQSIYNQTIEP